ncbi:hypothetical protein [Undibacterium umbellatum]|uniref:Lactate dehydrogenase n=1 Tax=Undibacterium umbellatum TaxID=2762300 RepID=A0ABR6Z5G4_9BURK|nr:hypothetical protein [Undibacterium umbellatum]MBC3906806.1 hypothetical protein [Undibacterium umbellatum]
MATILSSLSTPATQVNVRAGASQSVALDKQGAGISVALDNASPVAVSSSYQLNLRTARAVLMPQTYDQAGFVPDPVSQWLENKSDDTFSYMLEQNARLTTVSGRFNGVASGVIERFQTTQGDFKQAVVATYPAQSNANQNVAELSQARLNNLRENADQSMGLSVTLASGRSIEFSIKSNADGLSVEASSSAQLTESESRALEKLAAGLEKTANSYFADQRINLDALANFDTFAISSLKLEIKVGEQELNFNINQSHHQLNIKSASGQIDIDVSHDNPGLRGNAAQRNKAIQLFLGQIDTAGNRGGADKELVSLYKDAFSIMQKINTEEDGSDLSTQLPGRAPSFWDDAAQPLLTGLADFNAKITGVVSTPNPAHLQESDYFNYQVSQKTTQQGHAANGSISQILDSRLSAAFHQELKSNEKPVLSSDRNSQSYRYSKVEDHASSKLILGFDKNQLNSASLEKSSDRLLSVSSYELGKLVSTQTHPDKQDSRINLHVNTGPHASASAQAQQRLRMVDSLRNQIFLD